jgi:hypothetical protein
MVLLITFVTHDLKLFKFICCLFPVVHISKSKPSCYQYSHCHGVVSRKTSHQLRPCLVYCFFPILVLIIPVSSTKAVWQ